MYKSPQLPPVSRKPAWPFDRTQGTIITEFQSGHGFTTSGADASSNLNDTSDFVLGTQAATVVSSGTGSSAILLNNSISSIDTTNLQVMVLVKVDDLTHLTSLNFSMGNGGFTNEYHVTFFNQGNLSSGQWVVVTLSLGDALTQGSPTRSGITAIRLFHKDDNTGNKVTVRWGGVYFMPNAATQAGKPFPNGVASISFDDGFSTQWNVAKPYLDSLGIRPSIFVIKDQLNTTSSRLTLAQVKSMQDQSGWDVNAHTYTDADHAARLTTLTGQQLHWDMSTQKEWMVTNGLDGQGYAYPGGSSNQSVIETARRYFRYSRNTASGLETYPCGDLFRIKAFSALSTYSGGYAPSNIYSSGGKIDQAVANASWINVVFHKVIPPVASLTMSGNIATLTFSSAHTFSTGAAITLAGFTPSGLNGNFTIASIPTATTITVNIGSNPGNSTVQGTALTATTDCAYVDFKAIIDKLVSSGIAIKTMSEVIDSQTIPQNGSGVTYSSSTPAASSATAPTAGSATTVARSDHSHPRYDWQPADYSLISWAYDPIAANTSSAPVAGTTYIVRLHMPVATTITNLHLIVSGGGSGMTSGQNFAGLYRSGALIASTSDQSTVWNSSGFKTMALSGGPVAVDAGDVYVAFFANASSMPTFLRGSGFSSINLGASSPNIRFATTDTGRTTSLANTLGTQTAANTPFWAALS